MIENILAILAASIVIFIAGLLVRKQNQCLEKTEEIVCAVEDGLDNAINDFETLTNEELVEYSLTHLEKRMEELNNRLRYVRMQQPTRLERGKARYVKHKKSSPDD